MKILYLFMLIAGLLWIGDFSITLKPFSVSLPCWYKTVGILLFWLSMTIYVVGEHTKDYKEGFDTEVKFAGIWITVKSFHDEDEEYAKNCANELLEKLNEKI